MINVSPIHSYSVVGVDASVRHLATIGSREGEVVEEVANPRALGRNLSQLRRLHRARSRCVRGSVRYRLRTETITALNATISNQRSDAHCLTDSYLCYDFPWPGVKDSQSGPERTFP